MKKTFVAAVIALSFSLTGCSSEPQLTDAELQTLLIDPTSVAVDANLSTPRSLDYITIEADVESQKCTEAAALSQQIADLPLVAQTGAEISSNALGGFEEWIFDAGSTAAALEMVDAITTDYSPFACDDARSGMTASREDATLEQVLGPNYPGHLWLSYGGFDPTGVYTLAVTTNKRYILFVYAYGRSTEFGGGTFSNEDAGAAVGQALNTFTGR